MKFGTGSNCQVKNSYDDLTRLTKKTYASLNEDASDVTVKYGYYDWTDTEKYPNRTSGRVNSINYTYTSGGASLSDRYYEYDDNGNIKKERSGTTSIGALRESYTYDSLNQLTRNDSAVQNKSYKYTYDDAGNILTKKVYDYTTGTLGTAADTITYEYSDSEWGDLLTSYDGKEITYDAIGNMTSFDGNTFTWQGRNLKKITDGTNTSSYLYNSDGIRTKKTVNGTVTEYFLNGDQIIAQKTGDEVIWFFYDSEGNRVGLIRNGLAFYYLYNVQGDVVGIVRASTGKVAATYEYDAWGNCTVTNAEGFSVGTYNPFRYRGYYWDEESGLYYLNSRYYDPEIGRFISADDVNITIIAPDELSDKNLYSYCDNNPIVRSDGNGNVWFAPILIGIGTKYLEDVAMNLLDGKTGAELFSIRSTAFDYAASVVSAAIPVIKVSKPILKEVANAAVEAVCEEMVQGVSRNMKGEQITVGTAINDIVKGTAQNLAGSFVSQAASNTAAKIVSNVGKKTGTANITRNYVKSDKVKVAAKEARTAQQSMISKAIGAISGFWTKITMERIYARRR